MAQTALRMATLLQIFASGYTWLGALPEPEYQGTTRESVTYGEVGRPGNRTSILVPPSGRRRA